MLLSGGKDGDIHELDRDGMCSKRKWSYNSLVRAIDCSAHGMLIGLRNGTIIKQNGDDKQEIMHSHNEGEVWGLAEIDGKVLTSGDDNQVIIWDPQKRKREHSGIVS